MSQEQAVYLATQVVLCGFGAASKSLEEALQESQMDGKTLLIEVIDPLNPKGHISKVLDASQKAASNLENGDRLQTLLVMKERLSPIEEAEMIRQAAQKNISLSFIESQSFRQRDINFIILDENLVDWVQKQSQMSFDRYRLVVPSQWVGDLSGIEGLYNSKDSILRKATLTLIDQAFRTLPLLRYQNLDEIRKVAQTIATQA